MHIEHLFESTLSYNCHFSRSTLILIFITAVQLQSSFELDAFLY